MYVDALAVPHPPRTVQLRTIMSINGVGRKKFSSGNSTRCYIFYKYIQTELVDSLTRQNNVYATFMLTRCQNQYFGRYVNLVRLKVIFIFGFPPTNILTFHLIDQKQNPSDVFFQFSLLLKSH